MARPRRQKAAVNGGDIATATATANRSKFELNYCREADVRSDWQSEPRRRMRVLEYCTSAIGLPKHPQRGCRIDRCGRATARSETPRMKSFLSALCGVAAATLAAQLPSEARVYAADLYPYCSVDSSTGGMNCYISSRAQCEFREPASTTRDTWARSAPALGCGTISPNGVGGDRARR